FHFKCTEDGTLPLTATSIKEFLSILKIIPANCFVKHLNNGDIQRWLRDTYFLEGLYRELDEIARVEASPEEKRLLVLKAIEKYLFP
ncbi:MAG: hypothetical protein QXE66_04135, partial [Desulfurococcaceae archaeon]